MSIPSVVAAALFLAAILLSVRVARRERRLKQRFEHLLLTFAHDLKTPTAIARLHAERLAAGRVTDPERVRDCGHDVLEATALLTSRIDQLIDQVRGLEGRITRGDETIRLSAILDQIVQDMTPLARDSGLTLEPVLADATLEITGDLRALDSAIRNLVSNAIKFARRGTAVRVGLQRVAGEVWIWVRDHGPGLPAREIEALGEPFYRAALTRDIPGSGLGLAQVRATAGSHGGRVEVASREGEGTLFTLAFPAPLSAKGTG